MIGTVTPYLQRQYGLNEAQIGAIGNYIKTSGNYNLSNFSDTEIYSIAQRVKDGDLDVLSSFPAASWPYYYKNPETGEIVGIPNLEEGIFWGFEQQGVEPPTRNRRDFALNTNIFRTNENGQEIRVNGNILERASEYVEGRTPSDRGYNKEYLGLYDAWLRSTNREDMSQVQGVSNYASVIGKADPELALMLSDATGRYSYEQIGEHLYQKAFGKSRSQVISDANTSVRNLDQMDYLIRKMQNGESLTAQEYEDVGRAIGWTGYEV